jgi:aminopeptidase N
MKNLGFIVLFIFISLPVIAQQHSRGAEMCSHRKSLNTSLIDRSIKSANSPKHSFDVLNYTLNINLVNCMTAPYPNSFVADITINFKVDSVLNMIVLDADKSSLSIDSVRLNGVSFVHTAKKLTIQLDRTYNPGEIADVRIYYKHADVTDYALYASGGFVFTDFEPEGARKVLPCYDRPSDKATTDITAIIPSTGRIGSNGRLEDSVQIGNTYKYHWISRDPVATYLVVLTGKIGYKLDIVNWTNPNTSEVIPIRFYYNAGENPGGIKNMIGNLTTFFSQKFGDHPFEKNGFTSLNNEFSWGGMENQTLTSLCKNCWNDESLIAHEYAHQWFGDMVTCGTWADIFLNEGFATWADALWTENQGGYAAYKEVMIGNAGYYFVSNPHWAISVPSWAVVTPDANILFNYAITYMKGSCVLHMLRYTLGDEVFFPALKSYATDLTEFKYKSATIEDFKNKMETESGQQLDWFFDQWVYKPDHPKYENIYGIYPQQNGQWTVQFCAKQKVQGFLPYFQMPIELKIDFSDGTDTLVRVFNSFNEQYFKFDFDKKPSLVTFDPNDDILLKEGTTIVNDKDFTAVSNNFKLQVNPNPISLNSVISYKLEKPGSISIDLYTNTGNKVKSVFDKYQLAGEYTEKVNFGKLSPGTYFLVMHSLGKSETIKIIQAQ